MEQIAGEAFSPEQVVHQRLVSKIFNLSAVAVLGGERRFEKVFHVRVGNKSLDEVRTQYHVNGMNAINRVMRTLKQHSGWLIGGFIGMKDLWKLYYFDETSNNANI